MIHQDKIEKYSGSTEELVEDIGNLRYDALAHFLDLLAQKIENDGSKDAARKRLKLATQLQNCSNSLKEAKVSIDKAWDISEPYM